MSTEPPTPELRSAVARWNASQRKRKTKVCARPLCGVAFEGIETRKYCSLVCRVAAHRARQALLPRIKVLLEKSQGERTAAEQAELEAAWDAASGPPTGLALDLQKLRRRYGL